MSVIEKAEQYLNQKASRRIKGFEQSPQMTFRGDFPLNEGKMCEY